MIPRTLLRLISCPIVRPQLSLLCPLRYDFSTDSKDKKQLVTFDSFSEIANKNKDTYLEMIEVYKTREMQRRGHVDFIYAALKHMKDFGVEKDLEVYKALIDVLPKGKMVARNIFQAEFMHYPKQQQCAIDLLEQMEENAVLPDWNMEDQLVNVFGSRGYPVRRYWRMMYWMPKFKNLSPWPLPLSMPHDALQLAQIAIQRITSVDTNTEVVILKTSEVKDSIDDTWIISGQSPDQRELIARIPPQTPIYVEGGHRLWLRSKRITYFILRANPDKTPAAVEEENVDDVSNMNLPIFSKPTALARKPTIHEQEDGTILAVCATGTSSRDSLLSWVRILEKSNPNIALLQVLFSLTSPVEEHTPERLEEREDRNFFPEQK